MKTCALFLVLGLGLVACSKKATEGDGAKGEVKSVTTATKTDPAPTTPAVTAEETRAQMAKVMVGKLKERFQKKLNEDDLVELFAKVKEVGPNAKDLVPEVVKALTHGESFVRAEALSTLASIDPVGAKEKLLAALKDEATEVRQMAVQAWSAAGIQDLTPLLDHLKDEGESNIQTAVMMAVEKLGADAHVDVIGRMINTLEAGPARAALRFLVAKKALAYAPKVAELLNVNDVDLRMTAARGLAELGNGTKPVLLSLARGLLDEESPVRAACYEALKKLTGQSLAFNPAEEAEAARASMAKTWKEWIEKNAK
jgi:HEAT repeat protein